MSTHIDIPRIDKPFHKHSQYHHTHDRPKDVLYNLPPQPPLLLFLRQHYNHIASRILSIGLLNDHFDDVITDTGIDKFRL